MCGKLWNISHEEILRRILKWCIQSSMTNHLSGGEILEGRVIVGLQLHDRLQTLGWQHWEAVLPEVSGGRKNVGTSDLARKPISKKCYWRIGYRAECGKCHSQIFEIVQWQEGVFMDLRNVVLLHVPVQTIQDKSLHFFLFEYIQNSWFSLFLILQNL